MVHEFHELGELYRDGKDNAFAGVHNCLERVALDPKRDPVSRIIGIADVELFADRIDEALYGV